VVTIIKPKKPIVVVVESSQLIQHVVEPIHVKNYNLSNKLKKAKHVFKKLKPTTRIY